MTSFERWGGRESFTMWHVWRETLLLVLITFYLCELFFVVFLFILENVARTKIEFSKKKNKGFVTRPPEGQARFESLPLCLTGLNPTVLQMLQQERLLLGSWCIRVLLLCCLHWPVFTGWCYCCCFDWILTRTARIPDLTWSGFWLSLIISWLQLRTKHQQLQHIPRITTNPFIRAKITQYFRHRG